MEEPDERQSEELEVLRAIFDEDFSVVTPSPLTVMVALTDEQLSKKLNGKLSMKVGFPASYPDVVPNIEVPLRSGLLTAEQHNMLLSHLNNMAAECVGEAMVYQLVEAGRAFLEDLDLSAEVTADDQNHAAEVGVEEADVKVPLPDEKRAGGKWDFVIGLVGKPSAGKSTFFNAATHLDLAKTGAHPFTTIEPNIGRGFYTLPCPCARLSQRCDAAFGHNFCGERYLPVRIKDVAGLVPGACEGRGRGNRFLHDLLDADVLIHIVDASGCTNENGEETTGYDPVKDVEWLHNEIHRWIYDNVMEKWDGLRKRPQRLVDMFTGYHATRATIYAALTAAGVDEKELANLPYWQPEVLHRVVKRFLDIRFPIFLALNKADSPTAAANIERLESVYPEAPMLPVSAWTECHLQRLVKDGLITYEHGADTFTANSTLTPTQTQQLHDIQKTVLQRYTSTNVHRALNAAVHLRRPQHVFPVQCLDTLTSVDKFRDRPAGVLRDCVCLKTRTTVHEVYTALSHYPLYLLAGDFIRAETVDARGVKRIVRKDEEISEANSILRIYTNRKVSQVKNKDAVH